MSHVIVDEEAELEEAAQQDDDAREEAEQDGVLRPVLGVHAGHERHDGGGADGDVLTGTKHTVNKTSHEGGVQAVLRRKTGNNSVGDTLGDDCQANSEAGDQVRDGKV